MSVLGLAAQIVTTKATICALTPNTDPTVLFVESGSDLLLVDDARTIDRGFNVYAAVPGVIDVAMGVNPNGAQYRATMAIEVRYDALARFDTSDERILEDADQIAHAVIVATMATNVQHVQCGEPAIMEAGASSQFRILRIPVSVTYRRTF